MPRFIVLLRGVNVGKAKRVPMAEFRALLQALGFTEVQTLLNSGNAVCSSAGRSATAHATAIAAAIRDRFGFEVPVIVKTSADFTAAVASCPFAASAPDPARLLLAFTPDPQTLAGLADMAALVQAPERFVIGPQAAYLLCAGSTLDSALAKALLARAGNTVTTRNWGTVLKLAGLHTRLLPSDDRNSRDEEPNMAGWYEVKQNEKGQVSFVLKAGNAQVILQSEQYESKGAADNGIASVQTNSPNDGRYEKKDAKDGRFYFTLKAGNHQVIGTSQMYKTAASRDAGIESVKANGSSTTLKTIA